ncbi:MAG: nucleotide sugar dehydrogenase [Candidatus Bathyarchaeia archaeon]|nr:nucleotide sugar dehydrogenase [Candidatus Bathyarchaeota archaeon]
MPYEGLMLNDEVLGSYERRREHVITVVGCGRIGLPTACLFADAGFRVVCFDINSNVITQISAGKSPFLEPGLEDLLRRGLLRGLLSATNDLNMAFSESDIIVIAVDTPIDEKKKPDYSNLERACKSIGLNIKPGNLIILESTVGPGITEGLVKDTLEKSSGLKAGKDFGLAFSPVRASVGRVLQDMVSYPRVLAAIDKQSLVAAKAVLKTIIKAEIIELSSIRAAEITKLAENVYRDVNLALSNELALLCEKMGVDYAEVQAAANTQPYCHLLKPGLVGGHIPKDPYLLISEAENIGIKLRIPLLARKVNDESIKRALNLIKSAFNAMNKTIRKSRIAVLGVSYKPNIKEIKGSLVISLINLLQSKGAEVKVFDPFYSPAELRDANLPAGGSLSKTIEGVDCIVIAVGHERFKRLNLGRISVLMKKPPAIVDLAYVVDPRRAEEEGFIYRGLGRGVWTR